MKKQLVIMGGRGNGTVLAATVMDLIADGADWEILGILDDNVARGDTIDGHEVLGPLTDAPDLVRRGCHFYFAIQAPGKFIPRFSILKALDLPPDRFPSFVHPTASVSRNVHIGRGVAVTPLCYIGQNAVVGDHVYLHPHAVVSRDTRLETYSYLAANATLGAGSVLERGAYLGLGATVREYTTVGEWSVVGMGAAVVADVPGHTVVAGVPAKEFGRIEDRWHHDEPDSRPVVAVYAERFLSRQMTFVYGQAKRLERFRSVVLARYRENEKLFPWEHVAIPPPPGPIDRLRIRIRRRLSGLRGPTRREVSFWRRAVERERPALIHAHFGPGGLDMLPVARRTGVPLVVTFHGFGASQLLRLPAYRRRLPGLSRATSRFLCVCAPMVDRLAGAGIDRDRMRVWHHGVDTDRFAFATRTRAAAPAFLQISGLTEKKGVADSIRAFARYFADGGRGTFTLGGDGPLRDDLLSLAGDLLPGSAFAYLGPVDHGDLPDLMARADVFLHPSVVATDGDREGTPTVIMEAMATGLPVVSTRHEGIPELVRDGRDGILLEEGDTEGLAAAMARLAAPDLRLEMGAAGAERVRADFEQGERNRELENIYSEVAASQ